MKKIASGMTICALMIAACSADDAKQENRHATNSQTANRIVTLDVSAAQATDITPVTSQAVRTETGFPREIKNNKMAPPNVTPGR